MHLKQILNLIDPEIQNFPFLNIPCGTFFAVFHAQQRIHGKLTGRMPFIHFKPITNSRSPVRPCFSLR